MIKLSNITKTFSIDQDKKFDALNQINLVLPSKGMVFIVGKSGSGKSTLLNILGGLDQATLGDITIDGVSLNGLSDNELSRYRNSYTSFIYQEHNLVSELNVGGNLHLASSLQGLKKTKEEVNSLLTYVGLKGFEKRRIKTLSGGEKQRVAIARSLSKDSKMILADEPTGSLDSLNGKIILDTLKKISYDQLVVIVTHDQDAAKSYADRIIELKDGMIVNDQNYVSTQINDESNQLKLNKVYNQLLNTLNITLKAIPRKIFRYIFNSIFIGLSLLIIYITVGSITYDPTSLFIEYQQEQQIDTIALQPSGILPNQNGYFLKDEDVISFQSIIGTDKIRVLKSQYIYYLQNTINNSSTIGVILNGYVVYNENDILVAGRYPTVDSEVMVSKYIYDVYQMYGYKNEDIETYEDLLGKIIGYEYDFGDLTIVGIVESQGLDETSNSNPYESFHNCVYVTQDFFDTIKHVIDPNNQNMNSLVKQENANRAASLYKNFEYLNRFNMFFNSNQTILEEDEVLISFDLFLDYFGDYRIIDTAIEDYLLEYVKNEEHISKETIYNAITEYAPQEQAPEPDLWTDDFYYIVYVNLLKIYSSDFGNGELYRPDFNKLQYQNPYGKTGYELISDFYLEYFKDYSFDEPINFLVSSNDYIDSRNLNIVGIVFDNDQSVLFHQNVFNELINDYHFGFYQYIYIKFSELTDDETFTVIHNLLYQTDDEFLYSYDDVYRIIEHMTTPQKLMQDILYYVSLAFILLVLMFNVLFTLFNFNLQSRNLSILRSLGLNKASIHLMMQLETFWSLLLGVVLMTYLLPSGMDFYNVSLLQSPEPLYDVVSFNLSLYVLVVLSVVVLIVLLNHLIIQRKIGRNPNFISKTN